ncbi:MAG: beta-galactosidase [Thermoleophilia bacterium]
MSASPAAGRRAVAGVLVALAAALALSWPAAAQRTVVPVVNATFEGPFDTVTGQPARITGAVAHGFADNSEWADVTVAYSRVAGEGGHGNAQRIDVTSVRSGNAQIAQEVTLQGGRVYRLSARFDTPGRMLAGVALARGTAPYDVLADATVWMEPGWQTVGTPVHVTTTGRYLVLIRAETPGIVDVDDVTLDGEPGAVAPAPRAGVVTRADMGMHVGETAMSALRAPGFEGGAATVPNVTAGIRGALVVPWVENSDWANVDVTYAPDGTVRHGGGQSQQVTVNAVHSGRVQFYQRLSLRAPATYRAGIWVRGPVGRHAALELRRTGPPYTVYAGARPTLTGRWQRITVRGRVAAAPDGALLLVGLDEPGTYNVDDATLRTDRGASPRLAWPRLPIGTTRTWDASTWAQLEPQPGRFDFTTLDGIVARTRGHHADLIMTLGQTPQWASARPGDPSSYGAGAGAEPARIADWQAYVEALATRYRGRIRWYEMWNEPNDALYSTATPQALVRLTQATREVLRRVDPGARLISPSAYSVGWLDRYLALGGGDVVDVVGYHVYATPPDAAMSGALADVRTAMADHGVTAPLWLTEGGSGAVSRPQTVNAVMLARWFLVGLAYGADRAVWFEWGGGGDIWGATTLAGSYRPNAAGRAYAVVAGWLRGAHIVDAAGPGGRVWHIDLRRADGSRARIAWCVRGTARVAPGVPAAAAVGLDGVRRPLGPGARVLVTASPVLLTTR